MAQRIPHCNNRRKNKVERLTRHTLIHTGISNRSCIFLLATQWRQYTPDAHRLHADLASKYDGHGAGCPFCFVTEVKCLNPREPQETFQHSTNRPA